jgi:hypothetical protein
VKKNTTDQNAVNGMDDNSSEKAMNATPGSETRRSGMCEEFSMCHDISNLLTLNENL